MRARLAVLLLGVACGPPEGPRQLRLALRLHPATLGGEVVRWEDARLAARAVRVQPCPVDEGQLDGPGHDEEAATDPGLALPRPWTTGLGRGVSLLDAKRQRIPVGPWCGLDLVVDGPLIAVGRRVDDDADVELRVELPDLTLDAAGAFGAVEITSTPTEAGGVDVRAEAVPLVLELGGEGWLEAAGDPGGDLLVEPDEVGHDALRDALVAGSTLRLDPDRDGVLSDAERTLDAVGTLGAAPTAPWSPAP